MPLTTGQEVENYRIILKLGQGGQGTTYEATNKGSGGRRVIKEIDLTRLNPTERKEAYTEATTLEDIKHPSILRIYDTFEIDQAGKRVERTDPTATSLLLITEYIDGQNLEAYSLTHPNQRRLDEQEVLSYGVDIADGLRVIHSKNPPNGIIHRDMKPANCMRTQEGKIIIIDFGTALNRMAARGLTQAFGTNGYAPLEQYPTRQHINGNAVAKSDVYALAATLYALLAGREPRYDENNPRINPTWLKQDIGDLYNNGRGQVSHEMTNILVSSAEVDINNRLNSQQMYDGLFGLYKAPPINLEDFNFWKYHPSKWELTDAQNALMIYCALKDGRARAGPRDADEIEAKLESHLKTSQREAAKAFDPTFLERYVFIGDGAKKIEGLEAYLKKYKEFSTIAELFGFNQQAP